MGDENLLDLNHLSDAAGSDWLGVKAVEDLLEGYFQRLLHLPLGVLEIMDWRTRMEYC